MNTNDLIKKTNTIKLSRQIGEIIASKLNVLNNNDIKIVSDNSMSSIEPLGKIKKIDYAFNNNRNTLLLNITINLNKNIPKVYFKINDYYNEVIDFEYLNQLFKEKNIEYGFWCKSSINVGNSYVILAIDYSIEKEKILKK